MWPYCYKDALQATTFYKQFSPANTPVPRQDRETINDLLQMREPASLSICVPDGQSAIPCRNTTAIETVLRAHNQPSA